MAWDATLTYDASGGSDSAASGSNAPTTAHTDVSLSATVSGTNGTSTITFSATIDLTGVNDDGTDVIYVGHAHTGERRLFRITAFTGSVAACTGLTVAETIGATSLSAESWAIGGKRQTFEGDSDLLDFEQWGDHWELLFDAGNYVFSGTTDFPDDFDGRVASSDPSSHRPAFQIAGDYGGVPGIRGRFYSILFQEEAGRINNTNQLVGTEGTGGSICFYDCVFECQVTGGYIVNMNRPAINLKFIRCIFREAADAIRWSSASISSLHLDGCEFHDLTGHAVNLDNPHDFSSTFPVICNSVFTDIGGDGIHISSDYFDAGIERTRNVTVFNNVFHNIAGDGIHIESTTVDERHLLAVYNNIFSECDYGIYAGANIDQNMEINRNNLYHNNTSGDRNNVSAGDGDVTGSDPLFTSTTDESENFLLQSGSPAFAAGMPRHRGGETTYDTDIGAIPNRNTGGGGGGTRGVAYIT